MQQLQQSADWLSARLPQRPQVAVVLGTGLGDLEGILKPQLIIPYEDIPDFCQSTAPSHAGRLVFGMADDTAVVILSGRLHYYEGYTPDEIVFPIRVLKLLGVQGLILTNGSGCINTGFHAGDYMLMDDHLSFFAPSPCLGANRDALGPRFFDVSKVYDKRLQALARDCAEGLDIRLQSGVYAYLPGPHFETAAEIRALRMLGADAVGMSTVFEAIAAAHCGLKVLGISHLANMAAGIEEGPLECGVIVTDKRPVLALVQRIVRRWPKDLA